MNQAHDTWMASKHGPILGDIDSCTACHAEEGFLGYIKAKLSGFSSVYYHLTGQLTGKYIEIPKGTKPVYCMKRGCHSMEDLDNDLTIRINHKLHSEKDIKCAGCHDRIAHGWDEDIRSTPRMQDTCFKCHNNEIASHDDCGTCHIYQANMLKGTSGIGIESIVSPHFGELSCKDCHTQACAPNLETCLSCHDKEDIEEINTLQAKVSLKLEEIKGTLDQLERIFKQYKKDRISLGDKYKLYHMVIKNYQLINKDLSRGIHNLDYTWKLILLTEDKAEYIIDTFRETKAGLN